MPHEQTVLEKQAAQAVADAVDHLHKAESMLDIAEKALVKEERKHSPHVGIGNQAKLMLYPDVITELDRIREKLAS